MVNTIDSEVLGGSHTSFVLSYFLAPHAYIGIPHGWIKPAPLGTETSFFNAERRVWETGGKPMCSMHFSGGPQSGDFGLVPLSVNVYCILSAIDNARRSQLRKLGFG